MCCVECVVCVVVLLGLFWRCAPAHASDAVGVSGTNAGRDGRRITRCKAERTLSQMESTFSRLVAKINDALRRAYDSVRELRLTIYRLYESAG